MTLPAECKKIILLNALFQGGRLFVAATCVLYFLSFGLMPKDYAWIKTIQGIVFIGLDIPLGYLLKKIGEYKSLLVALVLGAIGAFGYLFFTSFFGFFFSEIFLAISISIWPVALSAYSMRILDNYKIEGIVEKFFHSGDAFSNMFVLACGSLGGILYSFNKNFPYSCFLLFYIIAIVFTIFCLRNYETLQLQKAVGHNYFSSIKEMKSIYPFIIILFVTQFLMQPLFHYWQPLFRETFALSPKDLSLVFIAYSLTMSSISWGYSRSTHFAILRTDTFFLIMALLGSLVYSLVSKMNNFNISLILFSVSFGVFNLLQIAVGVLIQNKLKQENRMIITKYVSFCSRIGMIFSLITLHWLFGNNWKISDVYKIYGLLAVLIFSIYLGYKILYPKSRGKNVFEPST